MAVDGTSSSCGNAGAGNDSGTFAVRLLRNRLYSSVKQTPVHVGGGADARANAATLIVDDATERVATDDALLATFVAPPAVEEIAGGALNGSLKLLAPWSGGPIGTLINLTSPVKPGKPRADRTLARARAPGAVIAAQFSARVDGWDAVVTAFTEGSTVDGAGSVTSGSNTSSKAGSRHIAADHSHAITGGRSGEQVVHGGADSGAGDACAPSGSSNSSSGAANHSSSGAEVCLSIYLPKLGRAAEATIGSLIGAHMFAPGESTNGFGAPVLQRVIGLNGLRVLLTVGNKPHLLTGALLEDTVAQLREGGAAAPEGNALREIVAALRALLGECM
ncbi:hypothetical protein JKP88DRAFT_290305 [Tribonema minus]|uniref:Uncharacterized protein n=1 Tax=Tribonema minus TaxID=303371 RepID=A0A836CFS9_9STRA|nr:hypothetical protein JKP88DRAFT_290305 [Tribonema minus]